jgi:hypothetical protein
VDEIKGEINMKMIVHCNDLVEIEFDMEGREVPVSYPEALAYLDYAKSLVVRGWSEAQTEILNQKMQAKDDAVVS